MPKQIKENGLKASQLKIDDDMISFLIRYYTRESGVRQLERVIATVCRKSVLAILKDSKRSIKVTKKLVKEWLGHEKFEYGKRETKDQIGTVTGLAYTCLLYTSYLSIYTHCDSDEGCAVCRSICHSG